MKLTLTILSSLIILCLAACAGMMDPLKDVDIPEPENADSFYYFSRAARAVLHQQADKLEQAKTDLETLIQNDQTLKYPEIYPLLLGCYQQLGLGDSTEWIYAKVESQLEANPKLADTLVTEIKGWIAEYPEFPAAFKERDFRILTSPPEPINGYRALYQKLEYPEMAKAMNRTGTTYLAFTIQANAALTDVHVLVSSYPDLDEEAKNVLERVTWKPAIYRGQPVPFQMIFPITFQ
jgi:TonB family protein